MVIFTKDMSTGAVINHGVSGYACLGRPGDFQDQRRGEPWQQIANDPILSYLDAQSHIGMPMSNFNEPWTGGNLAMFNMSGQPYRTPIFGETIPEPSLPNMTSMTITPIEYPSHVGSTFPQQFPIARIHETSRIQIMDRQNVNFERGTGNGDNKMILPHANVNTTPYSTFFQGANASAGTHPNNDVANQQTAPNTTRPDMRGGQAPAQKLPNGQTIGMMQPQEPPPLYELAPPPEPQVLPGEGTAPLRPTNPSWW